MKKKRVQKGQSVISFRCPKEKRQLIIDYIKAENTDIRSFFTDYIDEVIANKKPKSNLDILDMSDIFGGN